jgi:hypothetical protein
LFYGQIQPVRKNVSKLCKTALALGSWVVPQNDADWIDVRDAGTIEIGHYPFGYIEILHMNFLVRELREQADKLIGTQIPASDQVASARKILDPLLLKGADQFWFCLCLLFPESAFPRVIVANAPEWPPDLAILLLRKLMIWFDSFDSIHKQFSGDVGRGWSSWCVSFLRLLCSAGMPSEVAVKLGDTVPSTAKIEIEKWLSANG